MSRFTLGDVVYVDPAYVFDNKKYMLLIAGIRYPYGEPTDVSHGFFIPLDLNDGAAINCCLAYIYRPEHIIYPNEFIVTAEKEDLLSGYGYNGYIVSNVLFTGSGKTYW